MSNCPFDVRKLSIFIGFFLPKKVFNYRASILRETFAECPYQAYKPKDRMTFLQVLKIILKCDMKGATFPFDWVILLLKTAWLVSGKNEQKDVLNAISIE